MDQIAKEPFTFYTKYNLTELTGLRAGNIEQLVAFIKEVPGASIYSHTHRFLLQQQELSLPPGNDFAVWISEVLSEHELGEMVASIDIIQYSALWQLRDKIVSVIEQYVEKNPQVKQRFAVYSKMFNFQKSISFVVPTRYVVRTLDEVRGALEKVSANSLYFHIFEARLRLDNKTNDISNWVEHSLGLPDIAAEITKLDPYSYTMKNLRQALVRITSKRKVNEYAETR